MRTPSIALLAPLAAAVAGWMLSGSPVPMALTLAVSAVALVGGFLSQRLLKGEMVRLIPPLLLALEQRALFTSVAGSSVVVSPLGDDAVPLGAATLVLQGALSEPTFLLGNERPARVPFPSAANAARLPA